MPSRSASGSLTQTQRSTLSPDFECLMVAVPREFNVAHECGWTSSAARVCGGTAGPQPHAVNEGCRIHLELSPSRLLSFSLTSHEMNSVSFKSGEPQIVPALSAFVSTALALYLPAAVRISPISNRRSVCDHQSLLKGCSAVSEPFPKLLLLALTPARSAPPLATDVFGLCLTSARGHGPRITSASPRLEDGV